MNNFYLHNEKEYEFLRFLTQFGGCCSLKGVSYYFGISKRQSRRIIEKLFSFKSIDIIRLSEDDYLRSVGVGNLYFPMKNIQRKFNSNRKITLDPEKLILRNLRFLVASYLSKQNIKAYSFIQNEAYKIIKITDYIELKNYLMNSSMDDPITMDSVCICLPLVWSEKKCFNQIEFWKKLISDFCLSHKIIVFSISKKLNEIIQNKYTDISTHVIEIDNFEKNYSRYLAYKEKKSFLSLSDLIDGEI